VNTKLKSVLFAAAMLLVSLFTPAPAEAQGQPGSFCVSGTITQIVRTWSSMTTTTCGTRTTTVTDIQIDLDYTGRVHFYKYYSPDDVLCSASSAVVGQFVSMCGSLQGYILNPGTTSGASGWNLYPTSLTKY